MSCRSVERKKRPANPYLNWPEVKYSSVLYINLCASSHPFPPKYFPRVYEQHTHHFSLTRIFLIYAGNKWSCLVQTSKQWKAIFRQLSAIYRGGGRGEKRINLECWCEEQQEEIKKKKSSKVFSSVVEERIWKYVHCTAWRWWACVVGCCGASFALKAWW